MAALKTCLRDPLPELFEAARLLDQAVDAHLLSDAPLAAALIRQADLPEIRAWTESLWGPGGPWSKPLFKDDRLPVIPKLERPETRMPSSAEKRALLERDGHRCRFCGTPLIRAEVRSRIRSNYPDVLPWGSKNVEQHAAFQGMWLQYDHLIPHSRGGTTC